MFNITTNGAEIPALGFGTFRMPESDTSRMVPEAIRHGFRHIDTAQIYGNEAEVGAGIAASGVPRGDIFLTTKVWVEEFGAAKFQASVDESLRRLGTDHVDLLLLHWPRLEVPLAEQIGQLNAVRASGRARHIGVSNYNIALMREAVRLSDAPIVTNQVEFHPYLDQSALLAAAREAGIALTGYYAMADGKVLADPVLGAIGAAHGKSAAQVVLRWLVQQEVIALSKTVTVARLDENQAIFDFALSESEMARIAALAEPGGRIVSPAGLAPDWDVAA